MWFLETNFFVLVSVPEFEIEDLLVFRAYECGIDDAVRVIEPFVFGVASILDLRDKGDPFSYRAECFGVNDVR